MSHDVWHPEGAPSGRKTPVQNNWGHAEPPDERARVAPRQDPRTAVQAGGAETAYGFRNYADVLAAQSGENDSPEALEYGTRYRIGDMTMPVSNLANAPAAESAVERVDGSTGWPYPTRFAQDPQAPYGMLRDLFRGAIDEVFEDGMDSRFSKRLRRIVLDYGADAVNALAKVLDGANLGVAEEAIMQMGYIDDEATHPARLSLLESALKSPRVRIRDAASIGINAMDDPAAIESVRAAIKNEPHIRLRQNLRDVLEQLKDAR